MSARATLVAALLVATAAVPSSALAQTPDQTINAQTDPAAAAAALNDGCGTNINNCKLASLTINNAYDAPQILGDVVYNCAPLGGLDAYTASSISDTRGETTTISESISVKLQGGLIGIASASVEFKAFSSQSTTVSTTVATTTTIPVPPGYKGYTTTQVPSGSGTASYYVTNGIRLVKVTNIDLDFPGFGDTGDHAHVLYNTVTQPISPIFPLHYSTTAPCNDVTAPPDTSVVGGGLGATGPSNAPDHFKVRLCSPSGRCVTRSVPGPPPGRPARATAKLVRHGRTYAAGTDRRGRIRLTTRRPITAGRYLLKIERPRTVDVKRKAEQRVTIQLPVNVCSGGAAPRFRTRCA